MAHGTWNVDVHGVLGLKKRKVNSMHELDIVPLKLHSVGCGINSQGMVYTMLGEDVKTKLTAYDWENGIHINDIEPDGDWMIALSAEDRRAINEMSASPTVSFILKSDFKINDPRYRPCYDCRGAHFCVKDGE